MRSRASRGVPEWSGGKDLYMESCCSGSGKSSGFSVLYREASRRFRRIPEGSGGPENVPPRPIQQHGPQGGALALMGQGHQPPQGPCAWEGENPKGEGLHLTWEALLPPLAAAPSSCWI